MKRSHCYAAFALPLTALTSFLALPATATAIDGGASADQRKSCGLATEAETPVPPPPANASAQTPAVWEELRQRDRQTDG